MKGDGLVDHSVKNKTKQNKNKTKQTSLLHKYILQRRGGEKLCFRVQKNSLSHN
jgi:hypothetical protein